jgi:hypothetical protein
MNERILTACSLMAGAAVLTLAAAIQGGPFTYTQAAAKYPGPAATRTSVSAAKAGLTTKMDEPLAPQVIELPPIVVTGSISRERPEPPDAGQLEPCSKWRDIGPSSVVDSLPRRAPRVGLLCSSNGQPGEHLATSSSQAPG